MPLNGGTVPGSSRRPGRLGGRGRSRNIQSSPTFDEHWLQERIAEDPMILGLGDVAVVERERIQGKAGRLDLLLSDADQNRRYEVELMLGPTDPSHIIRTIEYWDIERRRYPAYDHIAVLVAENVTSRFLNVLALFSGSIPLVAIQLNALRVADHVVLDFVTVLDQTELRADDEDAEAEKTPTDRPFWESRAPSTLKLVDEMFSFVRAHAQRPYELNYNRHFIGIRDGARARNFVRFFPRRSHVRFQMLLADPQPWVAKLDEAGIEASVNRQGRLATNLTQADVESSREVLRELFEAAVSDFEE